MSSLLPLLPCLTRNCVLWDDVSLLGKEVNLTSQVGNVWWVAKDSETKELNLCTRPWVCQAMHGHIGGKPGEFYILLTCSTFGWDWVMITDTSHEDLRVCVWKWPGGGFLWWESPASCTAAFVELPTQTQFIDSKNWGHWWHSYRSYSGRCTRIVALCMHIVTCLMLVLTSW
jgi:hypothetical protein